MLAGKSLGTAQKYLSQNGKYFSHLWSWLKSAVEDLHSIIHISPRGPIAIMSTLDPLIGTNSSKHEKLYCFK